MFFTSSIFKTESGALFSCGWSADGQTGLGHYDNQSSPAQVGGDVKNEKIVKVACASDCVLALNGKTFIILNTVDSIFGPQVSFSAKCHPSALILKMKSKCLQ